MTFPFKIRSDRMSFIMAWNVAGALLKPKYITLASKSPLWVMNAVFHQYFTLPHILQQILIGIQRNSRRIWSESRIPEESDWNSIRFWESIKTEDSWKEFHHIPLRFQLECWILTYILIVKKYITIYFYFKNNIYNIFKLNYGGKGRRQGVASSSGVTGSCRGHRVEGGRRRWAGLGRAGVVGCVGAIAWRGGRRWAVLGLAGVGGRWGPSCGRGRG